MKRVKFTVYLPKDHVAKFSDRNEALAFARARSLHGTLVEVSDNTGLIGQYHFGRLTREFAHLESEPETSRDYTRTEDFDDLDKAFL